MIFGLLAEEVPKPEETFSIVEETNHFKKAFVRVFVTSITQIPSAKNWICFLMQGPDCFPLMKPRYWLDAALNPTGKLGITCIGLGKGEGEEKPIGPPFLNFHNNPLAMWRQLTFNSFSILKRSMGIILSIIIIQPPPKTFYSALIM